MIELANIKKFYRGRCVLDIPSLTMAQGERIALIGSNGSGKSTLLRLLAGTICAEEGGVQLGGIRAAEIGYLPQKPYAFDLSVQKNVELALGQVRNKQRLALDALERVGLLHLAKAHGNRLSGGELQRMALARVIARPRKLLLLDEPTASADIQAIGQMEQAVLDFAAETGCTLVFSSHAPSQAMRLSTRTLVLNGGSIAEAGETQDVLLRPKSEHTQLFLEKWRLT